MFGGIAEAVSALSTMFAKLFELKTVTTEQRPTTEIIQDKKDYKKATDIAEKIIDIVQKYKPEMTFADRLRFSRLCESFKKHN